MKEKKDSFLIVRISRKQKELLLSLAKAKKVGLSTLVRDLVAEFLDGK
jgi:hypothetical protein